VTGSRTSTTKELSPNAYGSRSFVFMASATNWKAMGAPPRFVQGTCDPKMTTHMPPTTIMSTHPHHHRPGHSRNKVAGDIPCSGVHDDLAQQIHCATKTATFCGGRMKRWGMELEEEKDSDWKGFDLSRSLALSSSL
jgi:hypothetical protein